MSGRRDATRRREAAQAPQPAARSRSARGVGSAGSRRGSGSRARTVPPAAAPRSRSPGRCRRCRARGRLAPYKVCRKSLNGATLACHKLGPSFGMLAAMEPSPRASFEPAGAGALLGGVTAAGVGVGALVGWAAGSVGLGALGGAVLGIPAGAYAVYRRYRGFFT